MSIAKIRTYILEHNLLKFLFFGNYFYALCALALSADTLLTLHLGATDWHYLLILFLGVIVFYTHAYRNLDSTDEHSVFQNPFYVQRTLWYVRNSRLVRIQQFLWVAVIGIAAVYYYVPVLSAGFITPAEYMLIAVVALLGGSYIGLGQYNIRRYGILKPFVIAVLWVALVTLLPVLTGLWKSGQHISWSPAFVILLLYNTIYILQLCILFDIKDYAVDARSGLKTFVVSLGLRRTMYYVVWPLYILAVCLWLMLSYTLHYTLMQYSISALPLLALAGVIMILKKPQPLLFYLFIVDGLMLCKGIFGVWAALCHRI